MKSGAGEKEYLYNHKELQEETGLYDYGARFYDPVIGRWGSVDKLAEHPEQIYLSPYAYVGNNPILKNDPDGNCPICFIIVGVLESLTAEQVAGGLIFAAGGTLVTNQIINHSSNHSTFDRPVFTNDNTRITNAVPRIAPSVINNNGNPSAKAPKGTSNQTSNNARVTGQEAHRQEGKKLELKGALTEQTIALQDGTVVRKDAIMPDGTAIIIKPDTPTGRQSAKKRENLLNKNGVNSQTILYDPKNPAYQPGSPTYIGPKSQ